MTGAVFPPYHQADRGPKAGDEPQKVPEKAKRSTSRQLGTSPDSCAEPIFQIGMSKPGGGRGGRRTLPYAFTEPGVATLSSVLNSERAVLVNIAIMRAFVRLREVLATHKDLARKLQEMGKKYDAQFKVVFDAIRKLMAPPQAQRRPIGFIPEGHKE